MEIVPCSRVGHVYKQVCITITIGKIIIIIVISFIDQTCFYTPPPLCHRKSWPSWSRDMFLATLTKDFILTYLTLIFLNLWGWTPKYLETPYLSEHLTPTLVLEAPREQLLATLGERLLFGWTSTRRFIQGKRLWRQLITNRPPVAKPSEWWWQYPGLGKASACVVMWRSDANFAKTLAAKISPGSSTISIRSCRWGSPIFFRGFQVKIARV